jgi:hypothetical protein
MLTTKGLLPVSQVRSFLDAGTTLGRYSEQLLQELLDQQRGADDEGGLLLGSG